MAKTLSGFEHSKRRPQLFIGLMSGTSLDGVDATLVEFTDAHTFIVKSSYFLAYDEQLREQLNFTAQNNEHLHCNEDSPLHFELVQVYAQACQQLLKASNVTASEISGIANHGQTVKHEPLANPPYSLQLGDGQELANLCGIRVYTQFRQADLAAGGQGAPLMPAFHNAWLSKRIQSDHPTLILNIGGIANITKLGKTTIGYDTGPGNVLLDQWIQKHQSRSYDQKGEWASTGSINNELLENLLNDDYFRLVHPKSTGTDYFNLDYLYSHHPNIENFRPEDVQATLIEFTSHSIALEIEKFSQQGNIYVCGGGAHNCTLMSSLMARLPNFKVQSTESVGVPSDWVEAVGFAWLGYCCHNHIASNMPSVTGASKRVVLGEAFEAKPV